MANTAPFEKTVHNDPWYLGVKCATDVTNTRLAYKFSATDHETVEVCGDNETIAGWPDRRAKAGETFNLKMAGHIIGEAAVAMDLAAGGFPLTSAAAGQLRKAVAGVDKTQGYNESIATTQGDAVTIRKGA
jgi:hypothetical protein